MSAAAKVKYDLRKRWRTPFRKRAFSVCGHHHQPPCCQISAPSTRTIHFDDNSNHIYFVRF